jgi:hypothetical protein
MQEEGEEASIFCQFCRRKETANLENLQALRDQWRKDKINLFLCLTNKHYAMKKHGGVDV